MKQKHIMEFFRNDDWRVRLTVFIFHRAFLLALVALCIWGGKEGLPVSIVTFIVKKFS